MKFPTMPWYAAINNKLEGHEWWINAGLLIIAVICLIMIARGDRISRAAWLVYLVSP